MLFVAVAARFPHRLVFAGMFREREVGMLSVRLFVIAQYFSFACQFSRYPWEDWNPF